MRATGWLIWAALILAVQTVAAAEESAPRNEVKGLLERMVNALRTLNYSGTLVYLHGQQLESMHLTHLVRDNQELERLVSLNGSARAVLRDSKSITCVMPESKAVSVDRRAPGAGLIPDIQDLDRLEQHYSLYRLGEYRVAARQTTVIGLIPKDDLRYGYRFYLDQDTGLPLKTDLMDTQAHPVEQIMFTSLDLRPPETMEDADTRDLEGFTLIEGAGEQRVAGDQSPNWHFDQLPQGFRLQMHNWRSDANGRRLEHLVLSDGLASVSVYIEQGDGDGLRGAANVGAVHAWGGKVADYWVTAVGEVPQPTVQQIVNAMQHRAGETWR